MYSLAKNTMLIPFQMIIEKLMIQRMVLAFVHFFYSKTIFIILDLLKGSKFWMNEFNEPYKLADYINTYEAFWLIFVPKMLRNISLKHRSFQNKAPKVLNAYVMNEF